MCSSDLADASLAARTLPCPSCGATLSLTLASTRTVTCGQCHAVVDVSAGIGAELAHHAQHQRGREPDIPLGRTGRLAAGREGPLDWQVVGFQERCSVPEDDEDERHVWREYLLYHRQGGFAFLVDASDGWSVVRPITGAPELRGAEAVWAGTRYRRVEAPYTAQTTWVQGEFYWQVRQGERLQVTDYRDGSGRGLLSAEQSAQELVWSAGRRLTVEEVDAAYGVLRRAAAAPAGAAPRPGGSGFGRLSQGVIVLAVVIVVMLLMARCDGSDSRCNEARQTFGESSAEYQQCLRSQRSGGFIGSGGGGSYGGFSSGGSHK